MGFVFYDTETTGTHTRFDQILQFAAIHTDDNLVELDRFEIRCRLQSHVVPHPGALAVTGMTIGRVTSNDLISHYEMIRLIRSRLLAWSPSIFVGYNSISFDEELLRSALFQTLHDPYLTNKGGNSRADALSLVRLASVFAPECLSVPCNDKGASVFKLDQLAPANGFNHCNAHDALADVEATIHLARCIMDRAPDCWSRFLRFSSKASSIAFIDSEEAFLLTEFYRNCAYHFVVAPLGREVNNPAVFYCLDLRHDPQTIAALPDAQLSAFIKRSPKPIRKVKAHKGPPIAPLDECPSDFRADLDDAAVSARLEYLAAHPEFSERILAVIAADADEYEESEHFEEQIYGGFPSYADARRMERFHAEPWEARPAIVASFECEKLRHFGARILVQHRPDLVDQEQRAALKEALYGRLHADPAPARKWTTIKQARSAVAEMMIGADDARRSMLQDLDAYLLNLAA